LRAAPPSFSRPLDRSSPLSQRPRNASFERWRPSSSCHESAYNCSCSSAQVETRISSICRDLPQMPRSYTHPVAQAPTLPSGFELPLEPRLPRIGSVDAVALEERAASLAKRSIKREAKVFALELAIRMMDLTTLEGQDTPGKVAALASKAVRPDPSEPSVPSVAAICVYPNLVPPAVARVEGTGGKVASVATAVRSGQSTLHVKRVAVRWAS